MEKEEFFNNTASLMYQIPFSTSDFKEPMTVEFEDLEKRIKIVIDTLWKYRDQMNPDLSESLPIYVVSLRMIVLYLNMSDAFFQCGASFTQSALNESEFVAKYQNELSSEKLVRASNLLAKSIVLLRKLGFKEKLAAISGDSHYYGKSYETNQWLDKVKNS